jgi:hypothetical protein
VTNLDQFLEPAVMLDTFQDQSEQTCLLNLIDDYTKTNLKEDQMLIRRTTKATTLAADAVDKMSRTWQEQVPNEYHEYGKVLECISSWPKFQIFVSNFSLRLIKRCD